MKTRQYSRANRLQRCHQFTMKEDGSVGLTFWCPGCNSPHHICIQQGEVEIGKDDDGNPILETTNYPIWTFNGDFMLPEFSPSVLSYYDERDDDGNPTGKRITCCHSFVGNNGAKPGEIIFLTDSPHYLSGKIIELPLFTKTSAGMSKIRKFIEEFKK